MSELPRVSRLWIGALLGVVLAAGLHTFYVHMLRSGMDPEGAAFNYMMLSVLLGFPTNLFLGVLLDYAMDFGIGGPGVTDLYGPLVGIVLNWVGVFWIGGHVRKRPLERPDAESWGSYSSGNSDSGA